MQKMLLILALGLAGSLAGIFILAALSKSSKAIGILDAKLAHCPDKPNCVCSEFPDDTKHYIEPILVPEYSIHVLEKLKLSLNAMGGKLQKESENYLAYTFTSKFFRFIDDLEIRIDPSRKQIHIRSASRIGYSDSGVNIKRAEKLKDVFRSSLDKQ